MAPADQRHGRKVNQVIQVHTAAHALPELLANATQNFFTKAALTVISSRVILPPAYNASGQIKQNKWVSDHERP